MVTKLSQVLAAMEKNDWELALRIAAKFPQLGDQKNAIRDGHEAFVRPQFYRQLGKDPAALIERAKLALTERYCKPSSPSVG